MNYKNIYYNLIINARNRIILEDYSEIHHIKPKCLGGNECEYNKVKLLVREHYIAHLLLVKIFPNNKKLIYSARMMCVNDKRSQVRNNREYVWLRKKFIENHPNKEEYVKRKISNRLKEYFRNNPKDKISKSKNKDEIIDNIIKLYEIKPSILYISKKLKLTQIIIKKILLDNNVYVYKLNEIRWNKGKKLSDETKNKQSKSMKKYINNLSNYEKNKRLDESILNYKKDKIKSIKRGIKISISKRNKKTNQQEIMGNKYSLMSNNEFYKYIKNRSNYVIKRMMLLRERYLKKNNSSLEFSI